MAAVLRLFGIMISIGLADSLNPTTIGPALYLATGERGRERVAQFTAGVFGVYMIGGIAIALGPGRLIFSLVPHPRHHLITHLVETLTGVAMITGAGLLWRHRARLSQRDPPQADPGRRSSALLGATITALELPTAFPYFAAIAAVVGAGVDPLSAVALILVFNLCFVLPLLGILGTLSFAGERAQEMLQAGRSFLDRHWPIVLAGLAAVAGVFVLLLGVTGLAGGGRGHFGRFMRGVRRAIRP
jgi:cytochrome c biogenesis protein CcdA